MWSQANPLRFTFRTAWRIVTASGTAGAVMLLGAHTQAQTWTAGRTTPTLGEIVALDRTGEEGWPFGSEDIEQDGLGTFQPPEQSLDIRTAYATADAQDFWARVYVSDLNGVGGNVTVYVFIDSDEDVTTGGSAAATDVDPALDADPTAGGYEFVMVLGGNGVLDGLFEWRQNGFVAVNPLPAGALAEGGTDVDPIRIGAREHGYVQSSLPIDAVGLTVDCAARLFVRSVNESAATTASDLDVGEASTCRPADVNDDGIPDNIVPSACASDAECPGGGVCIGGRCVLAAPCVTDADCAADEACTTGECVVVPQGTCTTSTECGDRVCVSGECAACTSGVDCGAGRACAPDGRCVDGSSTGAGGGTAGIGGAGGAAALVSPGETVQGGACTCSAVGASAGSNRGALAAVLGLLAAKRRGARRRA